MDLQKERKSTFSLRSNIRKKLSSVLYNIDIAQLSQNVLTSESSISNTNPKCL